MERKCKYGKDRTLVVQDSEGKSLEETIQDVLLNNEPIECNEVMHYTERKEGVLPQYDIRTDRFELAQAAADKFAKSVLAKGLNETPNENINKEE